jgi:hypothetical protein
VILNPYRHGDPRTAQLRAAPLWLDARNYSGSGTTWPNAGSAAATLDATLGNSPAWGDDAGGWKRFAFVAASTTYAQTADSDLLDVEAGESFTLLAVIRQNTPPSYGTYAGRAGASRKYSLSADGTTQRAYGLIGDATFTPTSTSSASTSGVLRLFALVRDVGADTITTFRNSTAGTPVTDTTTGYICRTGNFMVGRDGGSANYGTFDCLAVAFCRTALTSSDLADICTYYGVS